MAYVKGINILIGADTTQLDSALNKMDRNTKKLNDELKLLNNSLRFDPKNVDLLAQKQKVLTERVEETKKRLDALKQAQESVNKAYEDGDVTEEQYRKFNQDLAITSSQLEGYEKQLKKVNEQYEHHASKLGQTSEKLKDFGEKTTDISKKLAPASIAAAGALGIVSKQAIQFESDWAGVTKTVDGSEKQLNDLKKGIRDLAKEIPASTTEISNVAEAAGQLGIETDNVIDFTKVMIDMGNSTNLSADVAATTLARFANVTKMSQKDFSRLGSTIVALGNNFATTEAEIAAMAMNLGSAGTQIGMSQADIVALSTALSSVGLEAAAGGTAFSKVMVEMQLAVETNSDKLKDFASVAGVSSDQFAKAFRENATDALMSFIDGLSKTGEQGESAIKVLDDMGIKETRLRDSLLRSANASDILSEAISLSNDAWSENTALTDEANQRYETTESKLQIQKNKFNDIAISLGEKVLPHINTFLEWLGKLVDKFDNVSPGMQEFIVKTLAVTAVAAPATATVGKLTSGLGSLLGAAGKGARALGLIAPSATTATAAVSTASATASAASGSFVAVAGGAGTTASALGGLAAAAAPWIAAGAAVVLTGYAISENLKQDAIPAIDLFADHTVIGSEVVSGAYASMTSNIQTETIKISEDAQTRIQTYLDMSESVQQESMNMYAGLTEITDENINSLKEKNTALADNVIDNINRQKDDSLLAYNQMFENSTVITGEEQQEILDLVTKGSESRVKDMEKLKKDLNKIFDDIKEQGTSATEDQQKEIDRLYQEMKTQAIKAMADTEAEQNVILNRLDSSTKRVTADMVGNAIKEYNRLYDESVDKAGLQRDELVKQAELMKRELGGEYSELADRIIEDANKQYDAVVESSSKTRSDGLDKLKESYGDLAKNIDLNTGEMLSNGQKFAKWWGSQKYDDKRALVVTEYRNEYTEANYRGSSNSNNMKYNNGLDYVPYHGFKAILHEGEAVLTKEENRQLKSQGYLNNMRNELTGLSSNIIDNSIKNESINVSVGGTYVIREEADVNKIARDLAHEINRTKRGG